MCGAQRISRRTIEWALAAAVLATPLGAEPVAAQAFGQPPLQNTAPHTMSATERPPAKTGIKPLDWLGIKGKKKEPTEEFNPSQFPYARLCERRGDLVQARRIYEHLRQHEPQNQAIHHRLAIVAGREAKFAEAEQHFVQVFASGQPTAEILNDYGYLLYLSHRLPEAERVLIDALTLEPHNQAAHNNLGLVLGQSGRFQEALVEFRRGGSDAEAHAKLAYVYSQLGEAERAITHYSHALTLDPTLRSAAHAMVQLAQRHQADRANHHREMARHGRESSGTAQVAQSESRAAAGTAGVELEGRSWSNQPPAGDVVPVSAVEPYAWSPGATPPHPVTVTPYHHPASAAPTATHPAPYSFQPAPSMATAPVAEATTATAPAAMPATARIRNVRAR